MSEELSANLLWSWEDIARRVPAGITLEHLMAAPGWPPGTRFSRKTPLYFSAVLASEWLKKRFARADVFVGEDDA